MSVTTMTIGELCISPFNARTNQADANAVNGMAESLFSRGQLYPLVVHPMPGQKKQWGALAGGRRLRAFRKLIDEGRLPPKHPIDVIVRDITDEGELRDLSLAENLVRVELRPYEVYAACARANATGRSIKVIAETNGQTVETVRQWVRLGNLEPTIFAALERGDIGQEQAKAFAATEDHALQLHAYQQLMRIPGTHFARGPDVIRRMLKFGDSELTKLLRFVGERAYRDAGGRYELDLFAGEAEERGRVADEGLLMQLVEKKLEETRARLRRQAGRDLRFEKKLPEGVEFGGAARLLEITADLQPRSDADARRMEALRAAMAEREEQLLELLDQPDTPELQAAIAALEAADAPDAAELQRIEDRQRLVLPDGDLFGTLQIEQDGSLEIRWWWASRKAKRSAERPATPAAPVSAGPIPKPEAQAALQAMRPAPVPEGRALDRTYHFQDQQLADAAIKMDYGLTAEGVEVMRSIRRETLRAGLIAEAEAGGVLGRDYATWAMLRFELSGARIYQLGCNRLATTNLRAGHPGVAAHLARTKASQDWGRQVESLGAHPSMTEKDLVAAFRLYRAETELFRSLAAAILAGMMLERSCNADGYRVPLHDLLAQDCGLDDAALRALVEPTEEMVELLPKAERLALAQPHVDAAAFRSWGKLKAAELTAPVTRALKRARAWVHPLLRFNPPPPPAAPPVAAKPGRKSRKPESQIQEEAA